MTDPGWLTISEACKVLKVSPRTLYTYMECGDLPHYQVGDIGHRRIRSEDLDLLMVLRGSAHKLPNAGSSTESVKHLVAEEHRILSESLQHHLRELEDRDRELQLLRPLKVWAGHPCALCGEPLRGVVNRQVAKAILKDLAHKECKDQRDNGRSFPIAFDFLESPVVKAE